MTPEVLTKCFAFLTSLRLANAPSTPEDIEAAAEAWRMVLDDLTDDDLRIAVRGHLRDPERGRWWPTPADLIARRPKHADDPPPDPTPEQLWDAILDRVRSPGRYRAEDGTGMIAFGDLLDEHGQQALRSIGGSRAIGQTTNEFERRDLRIRFLRAMQGGTVVQLPVRRTS